MTFSSFVKLNTWAVNFIGAPALAPRDFRTYRQGTVVGARFEVITPTGDYDPTKLINLGTNRWGFKPEIGISQAFGRWNVDAALTAWFFTDNDDFFGGATLSQDPLYAVQGALVYNLRPGFWLALNVGYANGGTTTVNGIRANTLQDNSRIGATVQYPFTARQGLRFGLNRGMTTRIGADFTSVFVGYQVMWGGGL